MTTYAVGSHIPGCLPESDPWTTEEFGTAVEMMIEEVERALDDDDIPDSQRHAVGEQVEATRRYAALIEGNPSWVSAALTVGGRRYYVEPVT